MSLAIFCIAAVLYLLPAIVAVLLGRRQQWSVLALDLLAGWTIIGWAAAMIWAVRGDRPARSAPRTQAKRGSKLKKTVGPANDNRARSLEPLLNRAPETDELPEVNDDEYAEWLEAGRFLPGLAHEKVDRSSRSAA